MERILNDSVNRIVYFVAVDATDLFTRETGLSGFTVYYVLDNGSATAMTGPTTAAIDNTNMPGLYSLAIDEAGMTNMDAANDEETLTLHITHASIDPVTMKVSVYKPKATAAKLLSYIQLLARSDAAIEGDKSTELGEINANEGSGAGNYSSQKDSGEAIKDYIGDGTMGDGRLTIATAITAIMQADGGAYDSDTDSLELISNRLTAVNDVVKAGGTGDCAAILTDTGTTLPAAIASIPVLAQGPRIT